MKHAKIEKGKRVTRKVDEGEWKRGGWLEDRWKRESRRESERGKRKRGRALSKVLRLLKAHSFVCHVASSASDNRHWKVQDFVLRRHSFSLPSPSAHLIFHVSFDIFLTSIFHASFGIALSLFQYSIKYSVKMIKEGRIKQVQ